VQAEGRKASGAVERMPSLFWPRPTPHGVGLVREDHAEPARSATQRPARMVGSQAQPAPGQEAPTRRPPGRRALRPSMHTAKQRHPLPAWMAGSQAQPAPATRAVQA